MSDLRIVMAISADGFVAKDAHDDVSWTGPTDKALFKMLTMQGDGVCLVSRKTRALMPKQLPARRLVEVSRFGLNLAGAAQLYPSACLVGGLTLAVKGIKSNLVSSVTLMRVLGVNLREGVSVVPLLVQMQDSVEGFKKQARAIVIDGVEIAIWQRGAR